ncbi:NADPH:quinone oxidoreductase family protein [Rhizobium ruizarguesonis]|uniref:NADPH:quinone oxidoreductase family protein n=1 Tax=Rhizobium ruizarguesonis TaxID=2081791 RepID=UPI001030A5BF|nr:NADPH:quinone oxidoreductase family protein [Rhizobium ruizarguesonis]TAU92851.1 NADPH:quinone oxidoreductase family protein [Rhizobium ruizarguesonis]
MKAIISETPDGPETLQFREVRDPVVRGGEILIGVKACGVNFPDVLIIADRYQIKPQRPFTPGTEVSGVVISVAPDVEHFKAGDRVIGFGTHGGLAERIALPATTCTAIPEDMPFDDAAVFMNTYGTAYYGLKTKGRLLSGETLLVLGAAGGTGSAAVELGKALGARVVGAVSSQEKAEFVMSRGADECVIYPTGSFADTDRKALANLFKSACGPKGADVIYDPVGGDYTEAAIRAVARNGRHLIVGFTAGVARIPMNLPLLKSCEILGVFYDAFTQNEHASSSRNNSELLSLYASNKIKPAISERFPLDQAATALKKLAERHALGKLVVVVE